MANALYEFGKAEFLRGNLTLDPGDSPTYDIGIALCTNHSAPTGGGQAGDDINGYDFNIADQDWADVAAHSAALVQKNDDTKQSGFQTELDGRTISDDGTFDANDYTFKAVTGGTVHSIIIFKDTGTPANDTLIAYIDTATGLTGGLTPNGGDITIAWDAANGIFKL